MLKPKKDQPREFWAPKSGEMEEEMAEMWFVFLLVSFVGMEEVESIDTNEISLQD